MASGPPSPSCQMHWPCSAKREGGPPGKLQEQGPLNYEAAFLAPLRKAQVPQLNNSPPQEDPVAPAAAEVGQASAWPQWGLWASAPLPQPALGGAPGWEGLACLASAEPVQTLQEGSRQEKRQAPSSGWHEHSHQPPLLPEPPSGAQTTHPPATQLPRGPGPGQAPPPSQHLGGSLPSHARHPRAFPSRQTHQQDTLDTGCSVQAWDSGEQVRQEWRWAPGAPW